MTHYKPRGRYFEDMSVGQEFATFGRTVTEADIVNYAGLSGDYNTIHMDAEHAKTELTGERVAHGLLVLSIASGLLVQLGLLEGTIILLTGLDWKFKGVVKIGDTIHVRGEIKQMKRMKALGGGLVIILLKVVNQRGETVQVGEWSALVRSRPDAAG